MSRPDIFVWRVGYGRMLHIPALDKGKLNSQRHIKNIQVLHNFLSNFLQLVF